MDFISLENYLKNIIGRHKEKKLLGNNKWKYLDVVSGSFAPLFSAWFLLYMLSASFPFVLGLTGRPEPLFLEKRCCVTGKTGGRGTLVHPGEARDSLVSIYYLAECSRERT